ncbi:MAG: ferritin-like domain-containing protein [Pseudomonadota bacterium]|nr:ferritin-like domain-containing protein [Pseudomonadota bacterium]
MAASHSDIRDLLVIELQDLLSGEKQQAKVLAKLARKASDPELKEAFETHLEETEQQIERLKQAFELLGEKAKARTCKAVKGLGEEAMELMDEDMSPELMDAALICAAQKAEHYEIASYGSVCSYAEALGEDEVADLMNQTLEEEKATDEILNDLALGHINRRAMGQETRNVRNTGRESRRAF